MYTGLSLRARDWGFPPATMSVSLGYFNINFYWKTEEKWNQKESIAV